MTAVVRYLSGDSLIIVAPDGSKILINCQEGCQRSFLEYSQRLSTVSCICLSSARQEHAGGLPGALLTILDSTADNKSRVKIVGPAPSTSAFLNSLRHFMNLKQRVNVVEPPPSAADPFQTSYYHIQMLMAPTINAETRKRPRPAEVDRASYVFQTPRVPGKFQPAKAMELGVPKGPLFAKLCKGESVTLADGTLIESHQVMTADSPPLSILVLNYDAECPELMETAAAAIQETTLELVVHMVDNRELYETYGKAIWDGIAAHQQCHVMNASHQLKSSHTAARARSLLCSRVYSDVKDLSSGIEQWEYILMPRKRAGWRPIEADTGFSPQELVESTGALVLARSIQSKYTIQNDGSPETITFLGTGCAVPCKYRNVSGIFIEPHGLVLDAGEGTWAQMQSLSLSQPRVVWISHPHADHHLGLLTLLRQARNNFPVLLIAPIPVQRFLQEYADYVDSSIADTYEYLEISRTMKVSERHSGILTDCGITGVKAVSVAHCAHAYAAIIDTTSAWKRIVYSGDCRPSQTLKTTCRDCNVLIHEATFADDHTAEAVLKKHSTVGEAMAVGNMMQAKHIVLTHFSQRYPKTAPPCQHETAVFAHDYMRLTPESMSLAKAMTSAIRRMYPEEPTLITKDAITAKSAEASMLSEPGLFAKPDILHHA